MPRLLKNVPWRFALAGFLLGALVTTSALAALEWADGAQESPPAQAPTTHAPTMTEDERCAHMPEHCADGVDP